MNYTLTHTYRFYTDTHKDAHIHTHTHTHANIHTLVDTSAHIMYELKKITATTSEYDFDLVL